MIHGSLGFICVPDYNEIGQSAAKLLQHDNFPMMIRRTGDNILQRRLYLTVGNLGLLIGGMLLGKRNV